MLKGKKFVCHRVWRWRSITARQARRNKRICAAPGRVCRQRLRVARAPTARAPLPLPARRNAEIPRAPRTHRISGACSRPDFTSPTARTPPDNRYTHPWFPVNRSVEPAISFLFAQFFFFSFFRYLITNLHILRLVENIVIRRDCRWLYLAYKDEVI